MSYANMDGVPTQTAGTSELLASDWNTYVRDNFDAIKFGHIVCTSSTRPTGIGEGTMIYETDTNKVLVYDGSAWDEVHDLDNGGAVSDGAINYSPQSVVTSLPGSPVDGQVVYYQADSTNGVYWQLRYRSGSSSSYKWEFVGGSALSARVLTSETMSTNVNSFIDVATVGPTVTVPLAGDYMFEWGAMIDIGTAAAALVSAGLKFGSASAPVDPNSGTQYVASCIGAAGLRVIVSSHDVKTAVSASTAVKVQYWQNWATCFVGNRFLKVTPIRVG